MKDVIKVIGGLIVAIFLTVLTCIGLALVMLAVFSPFILIVWLVVRALT